MAKEEIPRCPAISAVSGRQCSKHKWHEYVANSAHGGYHTAAPDPDKGLEEETWLAVVKKAPRLHQHLDEVRALVH